MRRIPISLMTFMVFVGSFTAGCRESVDDSGGFGPRLELLLTIYYETDRNCGADQRVVRYEGTVPPDVVTGRDLSCFGTSSYSNDGSIILENVEAEYLVAIRDRNIDPKKLIVKNVYVSILQDRNGANFRYKLKTVKEGFLWFKVHSQSEPLGGDAWVET